jgi:D-alanyl-D-alanine carboxypeptidase
MPILVILAVLWLLKIILSFPLAVERQLVTLETGFQLCVRGWLLLVKLFYGLDVLIVDAARTPAEQNALHRQNPKNPAYDPRKPSDHVERRAVDVNFLKDGKPVLLKASSAAAWAGVVRLAGYCGLSWGGLFAGYADNNHFYLKRA